MKSYTYGKQTISQDDFESVLTVLKSDFLTQGPTVSKFEDRICRITGAKYAVAVNSGTAALHLSILALGIGVKDAGLTSPMTFAASANCLRYAGAQVQFADIDPSTGIIDPAEIEKHITHATKVIIPVHYAGQSCEMDKIQQLARKHNLFIVEDAAHAIGSAYNGHPVGSCHYSDLTTFSFHPVKTITTGEGGAVTTNNHDLYQRLRDLRTHGITQRPDLAPWFYEMTDLGFNYRMPDILAALGMSQLAKLDGFVARRRQIVEQYRQAFGNDERFEVLKEHTLSKAAFHLFPLLLRLPKLQKSKVMIFNELASLGIRLQVHYIPVHLHPYYRQLGFNPGDYPQAEKFYAREFSLPLYPSLSQADVGSIISTIQEVVH